MDSDVWYNSNVDIAGFQFNIDGTTVSGASGGDAEAAGFTVSTGGSIVLGFSFDGHVIPAGSGVLTNLDITVTGEEACLSDVVLSDADGDEITSDAGDCVALPQPCPADEDGDGICDDVDDCVGEYDECGDCNGDGIDEGDCDCDGNVLDCEGVCGGDTVVDDCGICGGDGTWCLSADITLGAATDNSLEVLYSSPLDIGGFQFNVSGVNIFGASGGAAEDAGFTVSTSSDTVIGFSLDGSVVPAGEGVLTNLSIEVTDFEACLSGIVLADNDGDEITSNAGSCVGLPCDDADSDDVCDNVDDCVGDYDECGDCNGDGIDEGDCDCDGNVLDCEGVCGGDGVVDECGDCNGDGTSCLPNIISLGAATESSLEVLYSSSEAIAGFQFSVSGVNVLGASGGAAEDAGFTVSAGTVAVLGFSLDGSTIPAGEGVLTNLDIEVTDFEGCLSGVIVSDSNGQAIDFETGGCIDLPCDDADGDDVCDNVDDCVGDYDECDVCNGDGTSCLPNIISLGAATESSLEVLYSSSEAIAGFQFSVSGVNVLGASGGAAEDAGLMVSTSSSMVLGFSLDGSLVPAGEGVLTNLDIEVTDFEGCLSDVIVSDADGQAIDVEVGGCIDLPCDDADGDGVCDNVDDCVGDYDECGVCNGDGIADGACDCDGNVEDECGECGGDGIADGACDCDGNVEDECGECGGDGIADGACDCDGNVNDCAGECGGSAVEDECGVCGGNGSTCIGNECLLDDGGIGFFDCELCCWDLVLLPWLGDGYCDDDGGCWLEGPQYDCPELGYDCGDCNDDWDGSNSSGLCFESECMPSYDTNGDSIVNILDVIMVVNLILGTGDLDCSIDYDNDGMVNVLDLVIMVNIILDVE